MVDLLGLTVLWMVSRDMLTRRWTPLLCHILFITVPQTKAAGPHRLALKPLELHRTVQGIC